MKTYVHCFCMYTFDPACIGNWQRLSSRDCSWPSRRFENGNIFLRIAETHIVSHQSYRGGLDHTFLKYTMLFRIWSSFSCTKMAMKMFIVVWHGPKYQKRCQRMKGAWNKSFAIWGEEISHLAHIDVIDCQKTSLPGSEERHRVNKGSKNTEKVHVSSLDHANAKDHLRDMNGWGWKRL